jgi:hypothetical protein
MMGEQTAMFGDSLEEERERIEEEKWKKGTHCKACEQFAKVYRRPLYDEQAIALIELVIQWKLTGRWIHITDLKQRGGDFAKLQHFGLIAPLPNVKPTKKRTAGYWKPTALGVEFAHNRRRIHSAIFMYNKQCLSTDGDSPMVNIKDVLPDSFDYEKIWETG